MNNINFSLSTVDIYQFYSVQKRKNTYFLSINAFFSMLLALLFLVFENVKLNFFTLMERGVLLVRSTSKWAIYGLQSLVYSVVWSHCNTFVLFYLLETSRPRYLRLFVHTTRVPHKFLKPYSVHYSPGVHYVPDAKYLKALEKNSWLSV